MVRILAFQARGGGSIPSQRSNFFAFLFHQVPLRSGTSNAFFRILIIRDKAPWRRDWVESSTWRGILKSHLNFSYKFIEEPTARVPMVALSITETTR